MFWLVVPFLCIPVIKLIFLSEDDNRLELGHSTGGNFVRSSFERKNQWIPQLEQWKDLWFLVAPCSHES